MGPVCGKFLVVCAVIAAILGFGYHLYHNLKQAHGGSGNSEAMAPPPAKVR
jgi:hypothetical protein